MTEKRIRELVENPRESLSVELKGWINPDDPIGVVKIVKAALAMRNNDGGTLLIGFSNQGKPQGGKAPQNVKDLYHVDKIQGLITKHSSEAFEVKIHFIELEGESYPIIDVPSGVKVPVGVKKPVIDNGETLLPANKIFVRSLESNGTPSTTEARVEDWPRIVEICFENREADVGRFIRRHLSGIGADSLSALSQLFKKMDAPTVEQKLDEFMEQCLSRFRRVSGKRSLKLPPHGTWEVALIIKGKSDQFKPDQAFLRRITANAPDYTGWPMWLDTSSFSDQESHPNVLDGGWEALTATWDTGWVDHIDFMRWEPTGRFYQLRALEDDVSAQHPEPLTQLDFSLAILLTAEAILVGHAFADAMGFDESSILHFKFRWTGIAGRWLSSWVRPGRSLSGAGKSEQDTVCETVSIPLNVSKTAIAPYVRDVVNTLFSLFKGYSLSLKAIEDWVQALIERNL